MLLANKVCVITGAASRRGIGRAIAKLFALHGGRSIILDLDAGQASDAASELGEAHRGFACDVTDKDSLHRRHRAGGERVRPGRRADQQRRHHPAAEAHGHHAENYDAVLDVNLRGTLYMSQAVDPAYARARGRLHRLHVVGLGPARRRHLRRPALQRRQGRRAGSRQGHGARARVRTASASTRHARPDPDRHHRRQADRRDEGRDHQGHPARPARRRGGRGAASACSWPRTSPPTSPAPSSTSTAAC